MPIGFAVQLIVFRMIEAVDGLRLHVSSFISGGKSCFSRGEYCFSLLGLISSTFRGFSNCLGNGKIVSMAGRMGEVGPPAAQSALFTDSYSHLRCSTCILPCGAVLATASEG